MKRSEAGGEGSSSKRIREGPDFERRRPQEDSSSSSSPGSGGPYSGRGRGYHAGGEGRDREDRGDRGGDREGRGDRGDREGREDRVDREGRGDRGDREGRGDRGDREGRGDRGDREGRGDRGERGISRFDRPVPGNGGGHARDREIEVIRRDLEGEVRVSPAGSSHSSGEHSDRSGRPPYERRDSNGGRPHLERRDSNGGRPPFERRDDSSGRPPFERRDSNGGSQDGRRDFDRDGGGDRGRREFDRGGRGGRPPFTGRGGPMDYRGGGRGRGGGGRGRGGRGRGRPRRDYKAEELARHDLVISNPTDAEGHRTTKSGFKGKEITLLANYFVVKKRPDWCLFHYRVDFVPDEERTFIKKQFFRPHRELFGPHIFDGSSLYVCSELPPEVLLLYTEPDTGSGRVELKIRKVADVLPTDVMYIQVLNIIVRSCLSLMGMEEMGRNFYDPGLAKKLELQKLELWPGYKTTIRQHENDVLLGVEMTHKVLRTDDCLMVIRDTRNSSRRDYKQDVCKAIVGSIVMTHYNRKTYRIDDIDFDQSPSTSKFDLNGNQVNLADYMRVKYQVVVRDLHQPLLVSRPKKRDMHRGMTGPILLIPELCQMTGLTDQMRENHQFMKVVNTHLHLEPQDRVDSIRTFMEKLTMTPNIKEEQDKWGLKFSQNMVSFKGRLLETEPIVFGGNKKLGPDKGDWTNLMKDNHMKETVNLVDWVVLVPARDKQNVGRIIDTLIKVSGSQNFRISQPKEVKVLSSVYPQDYFNAITEVVSTHPKLQMLFVILASQKPDLYATVKKRCCNDYAILSQCFLGKNVQKNLMSICTKVGIQMNAKLGGQPWNVAGLPPGIMIIGFDVYHCGKRKGESYGATVCSTNSTCSKYFSTVSPHKDKDELSSSLCSDITKCLHVFKSKNESLPDKIVMYRDGVGEGQLSYVYNTELAQIKNAITCVYGVGNEPKIAFIVVTKKINTRLFQPLSRNNRVDNPQTGTIVDNTVTLPERYDFFLVSQSVRQGTVSPTSYNVLEDTLKYPPDRIQKLTYMMTHMYYNSSNTVAVPAVCQYAHKLAYLTGCFLKCPSDEQLSDLLYYL